MPGRALTDDSIRFWQKVIRELAARLTSAATDGGKLDPARPGLEQLARAEAEIQRLGSLGLARSAAAKQTRDPDESALLAVDEQWYGLVISDLVDTWGSAGFGSVTSVGEALSIAHALAVRIAAGETAFRVFYRGETNFGWPLRSRAERHLMGELVTGEGLSDRELQETRRFQRDVLDDPKMCEEVFEGGEPPGLDDAEWLAIMQHYDESFGTRMLDLTSSVFAGLHFACIGWDGTIDEDADGLLYVFLGTRSWRFYSHPRTGPPGWAFEDEITEPIPDVLEEAFSGWGYPQIPRLYEFPLRNPRLVAQDGVFLIPGQAGKEQQHGEHFKLRVPGEAKRRIARELWIAGYTPERLVRGEKGREARARVEDLLRP